MAASRLAWGVTKVALVIFAIPAVFAAAVALGAVLSVFLNAGDFH